LIAFVVPGRLDQLTGGYIYDRHIVQGLRRRGCRVVVKEISLRGAARVFTSIPDNAVVIIDGLAGGVLPREIEREAGRLRFIALVHHPLAHETGVSRSAAARLHASERSTLNAVRHVVVTSRATATLLTREYGVSARRMTCIEPGTDRWPVSRRTPGNALLCVGTLTPRKGHVTLIRALGRLTHFDWRLTCVGSLDRDRATVRRVREEIRKAGLTHRVELVGETSRLAPYYRRANVFVLPTEYEGYGMAVAEAIASGLPVVSTPTGAIPDLVGKDAGILVRPGNVKELAGALERLLADAGARKQFAQGARRRRMQLPAWSAAVRKWKAMLCRVAEE
jgi:glycosyltransferase involved in cell wall biosynthesis